MLFAGAAQADAVDTLREFVRDVKSARAQFTQTVSSPDGAKKKTSSGSFAFQRPDRFRFSYDKPYQQLIVGDGAKVWLFDADLNQVSVRPAEKAVSGTPAALLAGAGLERDFTLKAQPAADGIEWVLATPKAAEGTVKQLRVGFKGRELAALEITDSFGQRSLLQFSAVQQGVALPADTFRFEPPKGAELMQQ
ncbi:outer membrane lipoprotein chaperone LolA [Ideonella sp. DXS22W]|uniref:Outer-membrane lipoprotein carrier protein n=2 Tax=Pseudaquabacterium inlustre TaxID=2984192 RepID=A0ABU9CEV5_9BURK